jgi:hypothetical protein
MGLIAFNARSGTIPLRCGFEWAPRRSAAVFGGSAESVLRSQEGSGKLGAFALRARGGFDRLQCSLRPGSAAASRRVSQRRLLLRAGVGPSRLHRRGHSVRPCLPFGGSAESVLRSQEGSGKLGAFALRARGGFDRLQCSLRPDSADASCGVEATVALVLGTTLESRVDCGCPIWDEKDAQYRCRRCIP